ncbi:MAG: PEGA domain-containing protein, partial [Myxococcota bacterium]|nr:PEGA domain-containing protein [Myxococcota bacterium]
SATTAGGSATAIAPITDAAMPTAEARAGSAQAGSAQAGSAHAGSAGSAALIHDAGSRTAPDPPDDPRSLAKIAIDSVPRGATVTAPDGTVLGKTPLKLAWPVSTQEVVFELRAPGYRKKPTPMRVSGNTTILVELERAPRAAGSRGSAAPGPSDTGLMRPE